MRWCPNFLWAVDEMTGLDEADTQEIELKEFIEDEIGGVEKIVDPKVREIVKKKLDQS